jgi:hypothetical protein
MKVLLLLVTAGCVVQLAFSAVMTHWFPRPNPNHLAWNTANEAALDRASVEEVRVATSRKKLCSISTALYHEASGNMPCD